MIDDQDFPDASADNNRAFRFGAVSSAIIAALIGHFLYSFYSTAPSEESGWSILFMPIWVSTLVGAGACVILPMVAAIRTRKRKGVWISVGVAFPLAFGLTVPVYVGSAMFTTHCWLITGALWILAAAWLIRQNLANDPYIREIKSQRNGQDIP